MTTPTLARPDASSTSNPGRSRSWPRPLTWGRPGRASCVMPGWLRGGSPRPIWAAGTLQNVRCRMRVWRVTEADRDADGKIRLTPPERHLADLLPPAPASAVGEETRGVRLGRLELAGSVAGLMLALIVVVLIGRAVPARQEAPVP